MGAERALTATLRSFFPARADVHVEIGDDAAVVDARRGKLAMCCDPVVEGVHFESGAAPERIGRKAVNRNLSDLAAMGARADWLLVSLILPHDTPRARLRGLLRGVRAAASAAGAVVVGGDVACAHGPLTVTVSATGRAPAAPLRRDALRVGDALHVTGPLGGSMDGHHLVFRPHLAEGAWLARQAAVRAAIDVSDGLVLDLQAMLEASGGLGAELYAGAVPVRAAARRLASGCAERALHRALYDGEDHCLLFGARAGAELGADGPLTARARVPIGRVVSAPGVLLVSRGARQQLEISGYEHGVAP
ncbi:MAG: thiamine-phosphate kinase [Planctomycetota bacterium]